MNLFVYGTLMDASRVAALTGRSFRTEPAVVRGYRKEEGSDYPYVVADPNSVVAGLLLHDVDAESLRRFDEYEDEGRLYRRVGVTVATLDSKAIDAMVYVAAEVGS